MDAPFVDPMNRRNNRRRLLVLSHAAVLEVNRALFQELARRGGVEIVMIVPQAWKGDLIRILPMPLRMSGNGSLFFYTKRLKKALRGWSPDQVFLDEEPWSLAALQACLEFRGVPLAFYTKQNIKKNLPPPFRQIERRLFEVSSFAFSVAEGSSAVLRQKGYRRPIVELPHSFDPGIFSRPSPESREKTRARLGIPRGARVFGYFGRLTEEKGLGDLLEAASRLLSAREDAFFFCVGNGPLEGVVREALRALPAGRSRLISAIPHHEVGAALGAIDFLVLPSRTTKRWKEQFGRVLVEAMACGAAVLGSDSGEIPEVIRMCAGGRIFREGDIEMLSREIDGMLKDESGIEEMKRIGHEYVHRHLSHQAVAESLLATLAMAWKKAQ